MKPIWVPKPFLTTVHLISIHHKLPYRFSCTLCPAAFKRIADLNQHYKRSKEHTDFLATNPQYARARLPNEEPLSTEKKKGYKYKKGHTTNRKPSKPNSKEKLAGSKRQ
jgi:hypothetical protein